MTHIPQEVLIDIMTRLPIKSILRFRCICSSWKSLVSSSEFIARPFNGARMSKNQLVVTRNLPTKSKLEYYLFHLDKETLDECLMAEFPFENPFSIYKVVGSIRGLICVAEECTFQTLNLFLWNPSIRRCMTLPHPGLSLKTCQLRQVIHGFGYDTRTSDYKVISILNVWKDIVYNIPAAAPMVAQLYSFNLGSWKSISTDNIDDSFDYGTGHDNTTQAHVNGIVHWLAWKSHKVNIETNNIVLSFDFNAEIFGEIKLPDFLSRGRRVNMNVSALGDTIALFENSMDRRVFHVWVMKEYGLVDSWTKQYTIPQRGGECRRPLYFRNTGEVFFSQLNDRDIFSNDVEAGEIFHHKNNSTSLRFFYSNSYVESLVLLDKPNGLHTKRSKKRKYRQLLKMSPDEFVNMDVEMDRI